jgi:hypothetical protein
MRPGENDFIYLIEIPYEFNNTIFEYTKGKNVDA